MLQGLTLRRSALAYLYRENPSLKRDEYLRFYDRVTASGVDVGDFSIQGPELVITRRPGPEQDALEIRVGSWGDGPQLRLLIANAASSTPVKITRETADLVWKAFQKVWGEQLSRPAMVEATLTFTAPAPGGDSRAFLRENVAHVSSGALHHLGRDFQGFGLKLISGGLSFPQDEAPEPALPDAATELRVETLMDDLSQLFIQAQVKWPTMDVPKRDLPAEMQGVLDGPVLEVNPDVREPDHYLAQVYEYVAENVAAFLTADGA